MSFESVKSRNRNETAGKTIYKRPRKRGRNSKEYITIPTGETVEVIEERNCSQSDSRLICASTGTSRSLILERSYTEEDCSDQEDVFFASNEVTGSILTLGVSQSEKSPVVENKKAPLTVKKRFFPFRKSLFAHHPPYLLFHSYDCTCSLLPNIITKHMRWKLNPWTPPMVRNIVEASGFRLVPDPEASESWCGTWTHAYPNTTKMLRPYQKVNHFPGTRNLGHKDQVWSSIDAMIKKFGQKHFAFVPSTYVLPGEKRKLMSAWNDAEDTKWIIKPPSSGCGVGVRVVHQCWEIPANSYLVVQRYLARPKLIDGAKFDLRLYVLVTSFDPPRVYLYSDGLVRIATSKYDGDVRYHRNRFMHLTNTSVNKYSRSYRPSPDVDSATGHLWSLKSLWAFLETESVDIPKLWDCMKDIVIKTLISAETITEPLPSSYSCFELFGFDILIEEDCKPWLLEVNTTPSLHTESPIHRAIKGPLVRTLLNVVGYRVNPDLPKSVVKEVSRRSDLEYVCHDDRLYERSLTHQATRKHFNYVFKNAREDYIFSIIDHLTPDDVRNLVNHEDELTQVELFERIFPTDRTHRYHRYFSKPMYYDMLLDAWETAYGSCRNLGIQRLQDLCTKNYHLMP